MQEAVRRRAMRLSILDGVSSTAMGSICGGIFLIGFAINVFHANPRQVGLLAALTPLGGVMQLVGSFLIERTGRTKLLCVGPLAVSRCCWIVIIALGLGAFGTVRHAVPVLVVAVGVTALLNSLAGGAWLAWTSDIVPSQTRGSFFGRRMSAVATAGLATTLAGGAFLKVWQTLQPGADAIGFSILFGAALAGGFASLAFLARIPEAERHVSEPFCVRDFMRPLQVRNFRRLVLLSTGWLYASQLSAPFFSVLMLERLRLDFFTITALNVLATLTSLFMVRVWGPLTDRFGNKPVILICGWGLVGVPLAWLFVRSTSDLVPLAVAHLATGAFTAGVALSQTNILVKLAPRARRSVYLAVSAATSGTLGALGPLSGGFLIEALGPFALRRGAIQLSDLHVAFFVSSALQIVFLCLWKHIEEAGAVSPGMVLAQLRDDLALLARGSTRSLS